MLSNPHAWGAGRTSELGCGARGRRRGLAAVPVDGGGAWPGFETTRRAKLAARMSRGRAAAHGRIEQPGLTQQATSGTPVAPQATPSIGRAEARGADVSRAGRRPRAH